MGNFWTVNQASGNLTSSGSGVFRDNVQTLEGQFLGDGGALSNVVYDVNSESGSLTITGLGTISIYTTAGTIAVSGTSTSGDITTVSGFLQSQINAVEGSDVDDINGASGSVTIQGDDFINVFTNTGTGTIDLVADAITGSDGITIASGSNAIDVQGFRTEFVNASGSLQTQITTYSDHGNLTGLLDDDHTQYILADGTRAFSGGIQANASGTLDIGSTSTPFDEVFGTPVVREYVAVSGAPRRGMIAIDGNDQFVGYNGTDWIIIG